jgi:hypothetical protein
MGGRDFAYHEVNKQYDVGRIANPTYLHYLLGDVASLQFQMRQNISTLT